MLVVDHHVANMRDHDKYHTDTCQQDFGMCTRNVCCASEHEREAEISHGKGEMVSGFAIASRQSPDAHGHCNGQENPMDICLCIEEPRSHRRPE